MVAELRTAPSGIDGRERAPAQLALGAFGVFMLRAAAVTTVHELARLRFFQSEHLRSNHAVDVLNSVCVGNRDLEMTRMSEAHT